MPYLQLTPYDILEVTPVVAHDQLQKAYVKAGKRRKHSPTKLAKAYNDLRNGRKRLEIDIFLLSQSGDPRELVQFVEQLPPCEFISSNIAPLPFPYEHILLNDFVSEQHEIDIPDNPYTTQLLTTEIDLQKILPTLKLFHGENA